MFLSFSLIHRRCHETVFLLYHSLSKCAISLTSAGASGASLPSRPVLILSHWRWVDPTAWMYIGLLGGFLFIIIQLILLVDFAHCWAERWVDGYEESGSRSYHVGERVWQGGCRCARSWSVSSVSVGIHTSKHAMRIVVWCVL